MCDVGVVGGLTCGIWAVFGFFIFEVGGSRFPGDDSKKGKGKGKKKKQIPGGNDRKKGKGKRRSRFPEGMTERKARAKATAEANAPELVGFGALGSCG